MFLLILSLPTNSFSSCSEDVFIYQSTNGGCNYGWTSYGTCSTNPGACFGSSSECNGLPWILTPQQTYYMPFIRDGLGTSMKIAKNDDFSRILQFEYTVSDNIYWDISLLNGGASGTSGTPFESLSMGPINDSGGTCAWVGCIGNAPCKDAYNTPNDASTRVSTKLFFRICYEDILLFNG
jgi:hypothetical protein